MARTYKDLDIYKESLELFIKTHQFSMKLPKYELYELGSQIRRSSDSINSNIVEGYGRSNYKKDFVRFLFIAYSSYNETINHLIKLEKLYPQFSDEINEMIKQYDNLGGKIFNFITFVQRNWNSNN